MDGSGRRDLSPANGTPITSKSDGHPGNAIPGCKSVSYRQVGGAIWHLGDTFARFSEPHKEAS